MEPVAHPGRLPQPRASLSGFPRIPSRRHDVDGCPSWTAGEMTVALIRVRVGVLLADPTSPPGRGLVGSRPFDWSWRLRPGHCLLAGQGLLPGARRNPGIGAASAAETPTCAGRPGGDHLLQAELTGLCADQTFADDPPVVKEYGSDSSALCSRCTRSGAGRPRLLRIRSGRRHPRRHLPGTGRDDRRAERWGGPAGRADPDHARRTSDEDLCVGAAQPTG